MIIEGKAVIANESLEKRDAIWVQNEKEVNFTPETKSKVLMLEFPMEF